MSVTKNELSSFAVTYEEDCEPNIRLCHKRTFTQPGKGEEYTCKTVAIDQSKNTRVAFGFQSGEIFITSAKSSGAFDWSNCHHIRMGQTADSIVSLAWDRTIYGRSYLSCAYERGRESEHFISLYDVNQGKDLMTERDVSEKLYSMEFLSADLSLLMLNCMNRNNITIFDRRFLSRALYEFPIGDEEFEVSHLEYNPNRYANITCGSASTGMLYELDIDPTPAFAHHLLCKQSVEPQETIVREYANRFSYGVQQIYTPLRNINHFRWCHRTPGLLIAASPCYTPVTSEDCEEWIQVKAIYVEHERYRSTFGADGSIVYCGEEEFQQFRVKHPIALREKKETGFPLAESGELPKEKAEELAKRLKIARAKPTFELEPEEIDLIFEMEQRERDLINEKIDRNHFEAPIEDVQRRIPFLRQHQQTVALNKQLQLWFSRSDINQLSLLRAKRGYGFATVPGSAKAIIKNSYYAIRNRPEETECLKECWKMLTRVYSSSITTRFLTRYGTAFPGVRRVARNLRSKTTFKNDTVTFRNKYYVSHSRDDILRMVGWVPMDENQTLASKLERLMNTEGLEEKTRAAAMAIFYMQGIRRQIVPGQDVGNVRLHYKKMIDAMIITMETNNGIQIKDFDALLEIMEDPYLLAMLHFLARRQFHYHVMQRHIMATHTLRLEDRIAIAAIHMEDEGFRQSLKVLTKSVRKSHDPLSVLLISGLDDHKYAHLAIHSYLAQTNDIQTAALILCAGNCFRRSKIWETYDMRRSVMDRITLAIMNNALKNTRKFSLQIVLSYMEWLQSNKLTLQKSYIMTFLRKKLEFPKNDPKIQAGRTQGLVACNFCSKPILPYIGDNMENLLAQPMKSPMNPTTNRRMISVAHSLQIAEMERRKLLPKSRGCPHCGRPLPRCLICKRACIQQKDGMSTTQMDDWFIWCTRCAHGGHLKHLRSWFALNPVCPAGDCSCCCPQIDDIFNANFKSKKSEQEEFDDPYVINGFTVTTLSATLNGSSPNESEKGRLVQNLKSRPQIIRPPTVVQHRLSKDSGISSASAAKSKTTPTEGAPWSSNETTDSTQVSATPCSSATDLYSDVSTDEREEAHDEPNPNADPNAPADDSNRQFFETVPAWDMTPEVIKQSSTIKRMLKARQLKQSLKELQINAEPDIPEDEEEGRSRRPTGERTAEDDRPFGTKAERRQKLNVMLRQENKFARIQNRLRVTDEDQVADAPPIPEPPVEKPKNPSNRWIVGDKDGVGRPLATQVTVQLDQNTVYHSDRDLSSSAPNIRFTERVHLLPPRIHPTVAAGYRSAQMLQQMAAAEEFKADVAKEQEVFDAAERMFEEQQLSEQLAKEQLLKEAADQQQKDPETSEKKPKRAAKKRTAYTDFDQTTVDVQIIPSDSEDETDEEAAQVARLCALLNSNLHNENAELKRIQSHGFQDMNSLIVAYKQSEQKKKERARAARRVHIRDTPEVRQSTPEEKRSRSSGDDKSPSSRNNSGRSYERNHDLERKREPRTQSASDQQFVRPSRNEMPMHRL
ncbi:Zinc-ribbon-16 domain-containing protein [Aphelenchoides fujianensis]|nr:Zinc-ribbon-16 domain-containing protein [Aphelenchoides fujianensis]